MTIAKKSLERDNHGWIELEISDTVRMELVIDSDDDDIVSSSNSQTTV